MQSPAPSRGTGGSCCQVGVPVYPTERSSPCTAFPLASDTCPLLGAEHPPKEFAGSGPKRFAEQKMGLRACLCAVSDGIYRL